MNKTMTAGLAALVLAGSLGATATASAADPQSAGGKHPMTAAELASALDRSGVSAQVAGATPVGDATMRLSGAHRYETAQAVSQLFWDADNTLAVALVSGENFPDSLSLPPATALLGPTLLVQSRSLPAATRAELERLRPCYIVAAGGTSVISDEVLRAANAYADPSQLGCQ